MMNNTVIVYGPQGTGKTLYAAEIANHYGCEGVVDDWYPNIQLTRGYLHLSNETRESIGEPKYRPAYDTKILKVPVISIEDALKAAVGITVEEALQVAKAKAKWASEKIVVRHLGTTTWQGPASQAPDYVAPVLTPAQIERLTFLIEECGEVIQEASKIIRFGFDSFHPDDPTRETNRARLFREMTDVMASYDILVRAGDIHSDHVPNITAARERKLSRARFQGAAARWM